MRLGQETDDERRMLPSPVFHRRAPDLIAEVRDLVEQQMPEIDTSRTRMIQRMPARFCTEKPSLPAADDRP